MSKRVKIPDPLARRLRELAAEYLQGPDPLGLHSVVRATGALPVYSDLGGNLFLRPDGEILSREHDDTRPASVEEDEAWRLTALVVAAEQFPELGELLPERPAAATSCEPCGGTGRFSFREIEKPLLCEACRGLGWLPPAV